MELTDHTDLLQMAFDTAPTGTAVMQPVYTANGKIEDFVILLANTCCLTWMGLTAYKGKRFSHILPMAGQSGVLEKLMEVSETGIAASFECWTTIKAVPHWFRFTAASQAGLLVMTMEDITSLHQPETALTEVLEAAEKQKRLYDSIINTTPDLVYVFDLAYRFTYANKALLAMWGKSAEEAIGKGLRQNGYEEWHAQMHEREIDEVVAEKKAIRGTVSFPHATLGKRVYDYIFTPVINEKGEVEAVAGTTRDITDLKRAEESLKQSETRFRNMIEQAPVALLLSRGEDVTIEMVNQPMLHFMNKTSMDEALGKKMLESLPELAGQPALQTVINVQKTGIPFRGNEQPVDLLVNGELKRHYFNFSYNSIQEADGSCAVLHMAVDVTEQVLSRRKIEESEARLKSVIDQTPAPMLVLRGNELVIEQVNKYMLQLIGRGVEIIGLPLIEVLPELRGQYVWDQVQKVYQQGIAFDQWEMLVQHNRTGVMKDYYYNVAYRPLEEEGKITGMVQVAIDVTEHVTARKKLEASESRFRALVKATSDVVYRMNADWTVMRNLEGRGFLLDTGEPIFNWMDKYIHPHDREKVMNAVAAAIANKSTFEMEHQVVNAGGKLGWAFSRAIPVLDSANNIIEWFGAAGDVTERKKTEEALKRSEEDLRNLVLHSPVGICLIDAASLVSEIVNDKFIEIAGKPYDAIKGKRYWDSFAEAPAEYESAMQEVVHTGKPFYANEVALTMIRHGMKETIYVTFVYEPLKDATGLVKKLVVWMLENTPQVQARKKVEESETRYKVLSENLEKQVSERTKELQRSNNDLQQFAHVASHDLKEPVRKVKTFIGRLEEQLDGKLDDTAKRYIDRINVATDRMFTMIEGVLSYSTINAAAQKPEPVNLNEVIKNIETDLEVILQKTGGTILYNRLPIVEGAPVLLYQLFYNLINNSIKFANAGTAPQITISSEDTLLPGGNFARITLQDNGIGFEPEQAARIFETFIRLNSKDKYEGTGLGLSLCKKIVERHNGTIVANGIVGKGATFTVTLPLQQKEVRI